VPLVYAHEQGVIHRDIKPENILMYQGEALVADFGIALAVSAAGGTRLTDTGLSLGTPEYMSPEQATGERELDARSDVYSLGAITYEMLVGEPPHTGNSVQAIIAKVVSAEAQPVSRVRHTVPSNVDAAVMCALAKVPADRFGNGVEFAEALTNPSFSLSMSGATTIGARPVRLSTAQRFRWGAAITAATIAVAVLGFIVGRSGTDVPEHMTRTERWTMSLAEDAPFGRGGLSVARALALSRDGRKLVYRTACGDVICLRLQRTNEYGSTEISGTEGGYSPFFSPDGEWIGFFTTDGLHKVRIAGGTPVELSRRRTAVGAHWSDDGSIIFADNDGYVVRQVDSEGGEPRELWERQGGRSSWPVALPGGDVLVHGGAGIVAVDLVKGEEHILAAEGTGPQFVPPDWLLFARGTRLFVGRLANNGLSFRDGPVEIGQDVMAIGAFSAAHFAVAPGLLVYARGSAGESRRLVWVDRSGNESELPFEAEEFGQFDISPDGTQLATSVDGAVWLYDLRRGTRSRLTAAARYSRYPKWSPDGSWIAAQFHRDDRWVLGRVRLEVRDSIDVFWEEPLLPSSFSPDGGLLAGSVPTSGGDRDVWIIDPDDPERSMRLLDSPAVEWGPQFSPDGRWLAYSSNESESFQIYVAPYPLTGMKWPVSIDGGNEPLWSPDGREIYFQGGDGASYMTAPVQTAPEFEVGTPTLLFQGNYQNLLGRSYTLSRDGQRFLVVEPEETVERSHLRVVFNWETAADSAFRFRGN